MMIWAPLKTVANGPSARRTARRNRSIEVIHEGEPALFGSHASRASERPSLGSGREHRATQQSSRVAGC